MLADFGFIPTRLCISHISKTGLKPLTTPLAKVSVTLEMWYNINMWKTTPLDDQVLFWDCDRSGLSLEEHKEFIIGRILEFGDLREIRWLFDNIDREEIKRLVFDDRKRRLSAMTINFWRTILQ